MGRQMATHERLPPMQSSSLYITDGDEIDWRLRAPPHLHVHVRDVPVARAGQLDRPVLSAGRGHRPRDGAQQGRRSSTSSSRPAASIRSSARRTQNCGPLYDDFETAAAGAATRSGPTRRRPGRGSGAIPAATRQAGHGHQRVVGAGHRRPRPGRPSNAYDLDGGATTIRSPLVSLPATGRQPDLPLLLRPRPECVVGATTSGRMSRRTTARARWSAGAGQRNNDRPAWSIGARLDDAVGRPDGPDRVRGRRPGAGQHGRGRRGRRPDHAARRAGSVGTERRPAAPRRLDRRASRRGPPRGSARSRGPGPSRGPGALHEPVEDVGQDRGIDARAGVADAQVTSPIGPGDAAADRRPSRRPACGARAFATRFDEDLADPHRIDLDDRQVVRDVGRTVTSRPRRPRPRTTRTTSSIEHVQIGRLGVEGERPGLGQRDASAGRR